MVVWDFVNYRRPPFFFGYGYGRQESKKVPSIRFVLQIREL
jgi:hypothetical protein